MRSALQVRHPQEPLLCASAFMAGYIGNDTGWRGSAKAVSVVQEGKIAVVFPEGTGPAPLA
jgi:hypothetical protein